MQVMATKYVYYTMHVTPHMEKSDGLSVQFMVIWKWEKEAKLLFFDRQQRMHYCLFR
jgi:hypothetical protein